MSWEEVECLGVCANAPMVQIGKDTYEDLTPAALESILDDAGSGRASGTGFAEWPQSIVSRWRPDFAYGCVAL